MEMHETLEATLKFGYETVEIWRFGVNDYAANFIEDDWSVRGTPWQIIEEIDTAMPYYTKGE